MLDCAPSHENIVERMVIIIVDVRSAARNAAEAQENVLAVQPTKFSRSSSPVQFGTNFCHFCWKKLAVSANKTVYRVLNLPTKYEELRIYWLWHGCAWRQPRRAQHDT